MRRRSSAALPRAGLPCGCDIIETTLARAALGEMRRHFADLHQVQFARAEQGQSRKGSQP
jgi:hypothetical protein